MAKNKPKGKSTKLQADVQDKNHTRSEVQLSGDEVSNLLGCYAMSTDSYQHLNEPNAFISRAMQPREEQVTQSYNIGKLFLHK
jgi:hypothetical protein